MIQSTNAIKAQIIHYVLYSLMVVWKGFSTPHKKGTLPIVLQAILHSGFNTNEISWVTASVTLKDKPLSKKKELFMISASKNMTYEISI